MKCNYGMQGKMVVAAGLAVSLLSMAASGQTIYNWFGTGDGVSYADPNNWVPNAVPGPANEAKWDQNQSDTVNFTFNPTNVTCSVENDTAVFNLNGHTYTMDNLVVGDRLGDVGHLTVKNGILQTNAGRVKIGREAPSTGTLILSQGASLVSLNDVVVGQSGVGTLRINAGTSANSLNVFVGDRVGGQGNAIVHGSWIVDNSLVVGNFSTGTLTVENGGTLNVGAAIKIGDGAGATGTLVIDGAGTTASSVSATTVGNFGSGSLIVSNGATLSSSSLKISDDFAASVLIDGGTMIAPVDTTVGKRAAGTLTLDNGGLLQTPIVNVINLSTLGGSGTITGTVITSGTTSPGNNLGILQVNGDFVQIGGTVNMELGGSMPGSGYDQLSVGGTATLGGTLNVSLVNGYNPTSGQFVLVDAGSISGTFTITNLPANTTLSYTGTQVILTVDNVCVADFNGDGTVNTSDVLAFLNAWTSGDPSADIDGDGNINTIDFLMFLNLWTAGC